MSNRLDPDQVVRFVGLIWVQAVCKGFQQMTLHVVGNALKPEMQSGAESLVVAKLCYHSNLLIGTYENGTK